MQGLLHTHVPHAEIWAFGSRVRGNAKPTSDLDLAIVGDQPVDQKVLWKLREAFDESTLPIKIDIVDYAQTGESFRNIIAEQKVVLQTTEHAG